MNKIAEPFIIFYTFMLFLFAYLYWIESRRKVLREEITEYLNDADSS